MGKAKQIGRNNNLIVDSKKTIQVNTAEKEALKARIADLSDEKLEKLFEAGKITQSEYEAIIEYRKKLKKKKTEKEKFEERIRCNNGIIQKIVNLGRKFRRQEILQEEYQNSLRNKDKILDRDERLREGGQKERSRGKGERTHDR